MTVIHSVSTNLSRVRTQTGAAIVMTVIGVLATVGFLVLVAGQPGAWIGVAIFGLLAVIGAFRWYAGARARAATPEDLILVQVRTDGVRLPLGLVVPWEDIDHIDVEWKLPRSAPVSGLSDLIAQPVTEKLLAAGNIDTTKRILRVIPKDFPTLKARVEKRQRGWFFGPSFGEPGYILTQMPGDITDAEFQPLLEALNRELHARGSRLGRWDEHAAR